MEKNYRIIKDPELAEQMEKQGYIILPFLSSDEIEFFKNLYNKYHQEDPEHFYKSYFSSDLAYKLEVEKAIIDAFNRKLAPYFTNYFSFGGMFVAKPPLEKGHFTAHQDWSFVDEFQYPSYNMWCPLTDVNDANGNLNVLKGSHYFLRTIRGFNTPDVYDHLHDLIEPNMISLPMKAGEVVIFYHGLVHGSTKNLSNQARVSLGLSLVHKDATLKYHYYDESKGVLEEYRSNTDFYINYVDMRDKKPTSIPFVNHVNFNFPRLSRAELEALILEHQGTLENRVNKKGSNPQNGTFFSRLKEVFNK